MKRIFMLTVALAMLVGVAALAAAAAPVATVENVSAAPGSSDINVDVGIPTDVDQAARNGAPYRLRISVTYDSVAGTTETVETTVPVSETALLGPIDGGRVEVKVRVPRAPLPEPTGTANFQGTADLLVPSVTPLELCQLTKESIQASPKYQSLALGSKQRAAIDAVANAVCQRIAAIVPTLTPAQKARVVSAYKSAVTALVASAWLTPTQADTLRSLADTL